MPQPCDTLSPHPGIAFAETIATRTFHIAAALVRAGLRSALVDNFTARRLPGCRASSASSPM